MQSLAYVHLNSEDEVIHLKSAKGNSQPANASARVRSLLSNLRAYATARRKTVTQARPVRHADAMNPSGPAGHLPQRGREETLVPGGVARIDLAAWPSLGGDLVYLQAGRWAGELHLGTD